MKTKKNPRDSAIPFVNRHGHTMRLSGSMTLGELLKMGFVRVSRPGLSPMKTRRSSTCYGGKARGGSRKSTQGEL